MIDGLLADHERVAAIAGRLAPFLDRDAPPVEPEFARLRWALLREVTRHHAAERAALMRNASPGTRPAPHDGGLCAAFNDHMAQWSGAAIQAQWARYRSVARALLVRLQRQMQHEEIVLFPQLRR